MGRGARSEFIAIFFAIFCMGFVAGLFSPPMLPPVFGVVLTLSVVICAPALLIIYGVRRLHDINLSGWWMIISMIPLLGLFFIIVLMILPGTQGPNKYGQPSK